MNNGLENAKHPKWKIFLFYAMTFCLMLAGFLMVYSMRIKSSETPNISGNSILGEVTPQILVDDTLYYWTDMAVKHSGAETPGTQVSAPADGSTYLPEGYSEHGAFLTTTETAPTEDLQMQAEFSAFGTVYRNSETPEVIYVYMTTDWFKNQYVRFTTQEIFLGSRIFWNGNYYKTVFTDGSSTPLEDLPKGAASIGTLHFIGQDRIPSKDLETNCLCDNYAYSLESREVFADPQDSAYIYVYADKYQDSGSYGVYWKCPLWNLT